MKNLKYKFRLKLAVQISSTDQRLQNERRITLKFILLDNHALHFSHPLLGTRFALVGLYQLLISLQTGFQ